MSEHPTATGSERRIDELQGPILHEYDGIEEADNALPAWWLTSLFLTVLFAVMYWATFETYKFGDGPLTSFQKDQGARARRAGGPVTSERLEALSHDNVTLGDGKSVFAERCVTCHGEHGEGKIGPNLTDRFAKNSSVPADVFQIISRGVSGKGMPEWEPLLGRAAVQNVTAYVLSLRGTNVPGKAPEGKPIEGVQ